MRLAGLPFSSNFFSIALFLISNVIGMVGLRGQCLNNVLPNPGFEDDLSNWVILGSTTLSEDAFSGNFSAEIGGDGDRIFQTLTASPGSEYSLTLAWKKLGPVSDATAGFKFLDANYIPISFHLTNLSAQGDFQTISPIVEVAPSGTAHIEITVYTNSQAPPIRVDDFCLLINGGMNIEPDVSLADIQGAFAADQGSDLIFTVDLINQGSQVINETIKTSAFLSVDDQLSASDILVGSHLQPTMPIGTIQDLDFLISIPSNFPIGTYQLILQADADDVLMELDEDNNFIQTEFLVEEDIIVPPSCEISLSIGQAGEFFCSNNGTIDDPTDDTWGLPITLVNPANANGSGWRISGNGLSFTGNWGVEQIISGFAIADGLLDLTFSDLDNPDCTGTLTNIPPPNTCSNGLAQGCADNLLSNSGFESGLDGWTIVGDMEVNQDAFEGANGLNISGDGNRCHQTLPAEVGDEFALSAQAKKLGNDGAAAIGIKFLTIDYDPISSTTASIPVSDVFTTVSTVLVEAPVGTAFIEVNAYTDPGASAIQVDDFCLRKNENVQPPGIFDFSISNLQNEEEVEAGSILLFNYVLKNDGDTDFNESLKTGAYLSTDAIFSVDDIYLGEANVPEALLDNEIVRAGQVQIPTQITEGAYFFILNADNGQAVIESVELNNWTASPIKISNAFDLTPVDCQVMAPLPRAEYLMAVEINGEEVRSRKKPYSDFRNVYFDISMSAENTLKLTVAFEEAMRAEYFRIFVDFNRDGLYGVNEICFEGSMEPGLIPAPQQSLSSTFNLSGIEAYELGKSTMRVVMSSDELPPPCGLIANGDVEDYSVNIVEDLPGFNFADRTGLEAAELKVFPNPANEYININLEDAFGTDGVVYLTNVIGQVVWLRKLEEIDVNVYSIDTAPMGPGIYGIWLKSENASARFAKVMVKHQ